MSKVFLRLEGGWQDKLFIAGEYSSANYNGYKEGGLNSGSVLASRLAHRFNLVQTN